MQDTYKVKDFVKANKNDKTFLSLQYIEGQPPKYMFNGKVEEMMKFHINSVAFTLFLAKKKNPDADIDIDTFLDDFTSSVKEIYLKHLLELKK